MKMPSCSAPGCSNRSDKDPKRRLSFHNLPFRNNKLSKKWLDQLRRDAGFMTKKQMRMSTFVMNTSQRIVTKPLTEKTRKDAVLKYSKCL